MSYLYFIKVRVLISLAYRFETISSIAVQFLTLAVSAFFWRAVYANHGTVQGVGIEQMIVYSILSIIMGSFFCKSVEDKLRRRIREGNVAVDLIKPINMFSMYFAEDVGQIAINLAQKILPLLAFACIFITVPVPASPAHFMLFLISIIFSFLILWLLGAIFGLLNFWFIDIGPLGYAKDAVINFLSGSVIPIWFFPQGIQKILSFTPFVYIYQSPIGIFIGRTSVSQAFFVILIQIFWSSIFFFIFKLLESRSMENVMVQGG